MKKIAQLLDLTDTALISEQFATRIAKARRAHVDVIHFIQSPKTAALAQEAERYTKFLNAESVSNQIHLIEGDLFKQVGPTLEALNSALVIVGTHGKQGLKQHLFGASILKLINNIAVPTLVVSDECKIGAAGIQNIVFPVGAHINFKAKIESTAKIAASFGAKVIIFQIKQEGKEISEKVRKNIEESIAYFKDNEVKYEKSAHTSDSLAIGYADQMLGFADKLPNSIISIMKEISDEGIISSKLDKELAVINDNGIPILAS